MGAFGHGNYNNKSYYKARKEPESVIPQDIRERFDENDIFKVWDTLDKVFHLNLTYWQKQFRVAFAESPHSMARQETFYRFLKTHLEKPLNTIRGNSEYEPIIDNIIRYVIRDKKEKAKETDRINYSYPDYSKLHKK